MRTLLMATFVASVLFMNSSAQAQGNRSAPPPRAGGTNVAVIDINHIFKHHQRFKQRMDELEARALVATLGPPRAAIESSLGEILSFEPIFAEVAARKRRAVIVNGRPRLVEGGRLALELRGWIRLHEDGPRVAGELELAHRSGRLVGSL